MLNTSNLLHSLYNFNGEDLMSIQFRQQPGEDLVVVHFEKNRQSYRTDLRMSNELALQLHDKLRESGCRRNVMVTPVMADVDAIVSVFDDHGDVG
jgi:hypothetical protein